MSEREKDWEYIFKKYEEHYTGKLLRDKLRYDGTRYMLLGLPSKARKKFLESRSYFYFFISLFGVSFYKTLAKIKLWLK